METLSIPKPPACYSVVRRKGKQMLPVEHNLPWDRACARAEAEGEGCLVVTCSREDFMDNPLQLGSKG